MTIFDDLPAAALRLIGRSTHTRRIPGTNAYARVCRNWRDAAIGSEEQEQLQLLLALEGMPPDTVTSASQWLAQHGACVTSLHTTYDPLTAPLFQQLSLSSAPLVGLARLEVDGPDSLVALAPALPQLVALTHLRASIKMASIDDSPHGVFMAQRRPLQSVPSLLQLCPGLRSLHLTIHYMYDDNDEGAGYQYFESVIAPVAQLLPAGLEDLRLQSGTQYYFGLDSTVLTSLTSLRRLHLAGLFVDPELLFHMPALEQVHLINDQCWRVDGDCLSVEKWLAADMCTAPKPMSKLTGVSLVQWWDGPGAMPFLVATAPGLRRLTVEMMRPGDATQVQPWVQQLSVFEQLRRLDLLLYSRGGPADMLAAFAGATSSVQQLTCLRLSSEGAGVPRSTWAAILQHLPQLRVLGVPKQLLLEEGLAPELTSLTQLQCLYVHCREYGWDSAASGAEVAAHLQVLSQCSSLRAVLCWSYAHSPSGLWAAVHGGELHLSSWHNWCHAAREGRVVCPRPCPHLPDVWELHQQEPAVGHDSN